MGFNKKRQPLFLISKIKMRRSLFHPRKNSQGRMPFMDRKLLELAKLTAEFSLCRRRKVGAILTDLHGELIGFGYNTAPSSLQDCMKRGSCIREELVIQSGTRHEICRAVHAEHMAIHDALVSGRSPLMGTIYITHSPCSFCAREIIEAGIRRVVNAEGYPDPFALSLLEEACVTVERLQA